jgi:hypothetical protein
MSSANRDILTVSLPICIPFIPSSCLIALARNSSTMLKQGRILSQSPSALSQRGFVPHAWPPAFRIQATLFSSGCLCSAAQGHACLSCMLFLRLLSYALLTLWSCILWISSIPKPHVWSTALAQCSGAIGTLTPDCVLQG